MHKLNNSEETSSGNGSGLDDGEKKSLKRTDNKLKPNKDADGDHSSFKRDDNGNVYKYETYEKTQSGHYNPVKRYDGGQKNGQPGAPHINKKTKESVSTPHVQGRDAPGGARRALPSEIPKKANP